MSRPNFLARILIVASLLQASSSLAATIAYYRFENGSPGSPATGTGAILDSSGNNLNGTAINSPLYSSNVPTSLIPQTGAANTLSMSFDGSSQRIAIPDNSAFQLTQSLTIEAYIDPFTNTGGGSNGYKQIFFRGDDRAQFDPYFLAQQNGNITFQIGDNTGGTTTVSAPLPGINQWIFVAATLNDSTGAMDLYINGNLAASKTTTMRPLGALDPAENPGVAIGSLQSNLANADPQFFNGLIDEVRLSDVALTPAQFLDAPLPEPTSLALFAFAAATALMRRRPTA